jgi:hypothetical protein
MNTREHQSIKVLIMSPRLCWSLDEGEWVVALLHAPKQEMVDRLNEHA